LRPGAQSHSFREAFLAIPVLSNPIPLSLFIAAAEIYQQGRRKGITIRSSVDCLIAAIAIENGIPVWHRDRDFGAIARYTGLQVAHPARL
jgi:predicted nucleic acid-binding protein